MHHGCARFGRRLLAAATGLLVGSGIMAAAAPAVHAAGPAAHYVMTAFTRSSESNMNVYASSDALNWNTVKINAYTPPSGLIRDPSILRHTDGYYYLTYTTNWTGDTIGFARSTNQINWQFLRNVKVGLNGNTGSTWAPEWFKDSDGSVHVIFSASAEGRGGQFRPYRIKATDAALSTWTAPVPLGLPANYIDSFVVKEGGVYHNFVKNETTKYIEHATSSSLGGPWRFVGTGNWAGWGSGLEGPALAQLPNGNWRIYFDQYSGGRYFYADGDLNTFSAKTELPGLSGVARHFTVLRENVGDGVVVPTGRRTIASVNKAGHVIRHKNFAALLEQVGPASAALDRADATFTVVAGLANGNCYSFAAVNVTGYYLRHDDFKLRLAQNDGSAGFRSDATFCGRTGFAGGGSLSFESYNFPGHYLRHYDFQIQLDARASGAFPADASFNVTNALG
ncbi:glycoside hydrolase family 43 protein [Lentzea sp. HUAS12]|uniref:glycoside hydrolase family 43 protein n=1 Tax=Lentzea sp. HUAS12 TaxID=2951806 RepID=UPI00209CB8CE|nr:glycoside hydrolase family 43 protein [Lentzea sp. HUAS12]USX56303.1 glycoside hydrolase family 43 protein [Lentzea sp. HUAS12]